MALLAFSNDYTELQRLGPLDRHLFGASIRALKAGGDTQLYEAVAYAYDRLQERGDTERINVIVAMTDGQSKGNISTVQLRIRGADFPVLIFTVAYGGDADMKVLSQIAEWGDGQAYASDPETVRKLYELISRFF